MIFVMLPIADRDEHDIKMATAGLWRFDKGFYPKKKVSRLDPYMSVIQSSFIVFLMTIILLYNTKLRGGILEPPFVHPIFRVHTHFAYSYTLSSKDAAACYF